MLGGGMENWQAPKQTSAPVPKQLQRKQQAATEKGIADVLDSMGTQQWRVEDLRDHVNATKDRNIKGDTVRKYLNILVDRKLVVRSTAKQPFKFWRA